MLDDLLNRIELEVSQATSRVRLAPRIDQAILTHGVSKQLEFAATRRLLVQIDVLEFDPSLLQESLGLSCDRALLSSVELYHGQSVYARRPGVTNRFDPRRVCMPCSAPP